MSGRGVGLVVRLRRRGQPVLVASSWWCGGRACAFSAFEHTCIYGVFWLVFMRAVRCSRDARMRSGLLPRDAAEGWSRTLPATPSAVVPPIRTRPISVRRHLALLDQEFENLPPENMMSYVRSGPTPPNTSACGVACAVVGVRLFVVCVAGLCGSHPELLHQ